MYSLKRCFHPIENLWMNRAIRETSHSQLKALERAGEERRLFKIHKSGEIRTLSAFENRWRTFLYAIVGSSQWNISNYEAWMLFLDEHEGDRFIRQMEWFKITEAIINQAPEPYSGDETAALDQLKLRVLALKYRMELLPMPAENNFDTVSVEAYPLMRQARLWKLRQVYWSRSDLTNQEIQALRQLAGYSQLVHLIVNNPSIEEACFKWILRDHLPLDVFIQFPGICQRIVRARLDGRISRVNSNHIKIRMQGNSKIVTLPFEGKDENILNEDLMISFSGGYLLSVKEIFFIFESKYLRVGNLEYFSKGICNWNVHRLGYWDQNLRDYISVDLRLKEWWRQMPVLEHLTLDAAQRRYGARLDGTLWGVAVAATRGSKSLDFDQTHAFLEIAIPFSDGSYEIFDFGKFAIQFPASQFENLSLFCKNLPATIAYPDENIFYTHREFTTHVFYFSPEQGTSVMASMRHDLELSRDGHFVYQIESDNCAKWAQEKVECYFDKDEFPNLFCMNLLQTEPVGPVAYVFDWIKKLPQHFQIDVLTALHLPFGAATGRWILEQGKHVYKSLTRHNFWETGVVYLPAFLHHQQHHGALNRYWVPDSFVKYLQNKLMHWMSFIRKMYAVLKVFVYCYEKTWRLVMKIQPLDEAYWHSRVKLCLIEEERKHSPPGQRSCLSHAH